MKSAKVISVIVPVYNVEKYLRRCLDSIIDQTYKNLEIILVDDGSTDGSGKICDEYKKKDTRVKVIHKKNGGLSDARNIGIKEANGDYYSFIDSDDWINVEMLSTLVSLLEKNDSDIAECGLLKTKGNVVKSMGRNQIKKYTQKEYMKEFFKIGSQKTRYYACTKLYKANLIDDNQYPKGLTSEDVEGTFKALLRANSISTTSAKLYYYYSNPKSITGSSLSLKLFDMIKVWDNVVKLSANTPYNKWAILNRNRIDYTILMQLATKTSEQQFERLFKPQTSYCLSRLKQNYRELLRTAIPLSRKLTMVLIVKNYSLFSRFTRALRR